MADHFTSCVPTTWPRSTPTSSEEPSTLIPSSAPADADEPSSAYTGEQDVARIFSEVLPRPATEPDTLRFSTGPLHDFRKFVADHARAFGLSSARTDDLVLAANEMATNSVLHGGGSGLARVWGEDETLSL